MFVRRCRSLLPAVSAAVLLQVLSAAPAPAAPASVAASPRHRTDPGAVPLHVRSPETGSAGAPASSIPTRGSTTSPTTSRSASGQAPTRPAATPLTPVVGTNFDAIGQQDGNYPADPTGAIGATHIVTAVNTSLAVYDLTGNLLVGPTRLADVISITGQKFDPKVVYDQYTGDFVVVWLVRDRSSERSRIAVATIPDATANTIGSWCGVVFDGDIVKGNGRQWADYPTLGYDSDSVAITSNAFDFGAPGGFAYAQIYHIANSELFGTCDPAVPVVFTPFTGSQTRDPDGTKAFTIQAAQTEGTSNDQLFLSYEDVSPSIVVWRLRETSNGLSLARRAIPVTRARISFYGTQKGGSLRDIDTFWDPGDLRLVNAFYDADLNRVYAAHTIYRDLKPDTVTGGYPEAVIRWYEVQPTRRLRASRVTRTGIVGTPETDAGWPVVATDSVGNLFVAYSRASKPKGEYLSAWSAEIAPGTTTAVLTELKAGEARMEAVNGVERWGDFNAINRDPLDGTLVGMVDQYAKDDGVLPSGVTRDWQQVFDLVSDG